VDDSAADEISIPTLRRISYGGSPITESLLTRAADRWPRVSFCQSYGQTEVAPIATILTADDHIGDARARGLTRSAGRAAPHCEVQVVDEDHRVLGPGAIGEICVRGPNAMTGYWGLPSETARTVVDGWVHSGDGGYLDENGYLFVVDRLKDMIITGGENVYSVEVENALAKHAAVAACAVVGVPDDQWGERVHAVVVLRPGTTVTVDELREYAREFIAGYKLPRTVDFVDALPMSTTGKILKRDIRQRILAGYQPAR
jgi:acyl-CoA synthetase (AMP-forming)/AMP-acid ligase II